MRVLLQRCQRAGVSIAGEAVAEIGQGLLLLLGIEASDGSEDIDYLIRKLVAMRIFDDEQGVMNKSVLDIGGEVLLVSQFTLMASTKKGNRPSYIRAAKPEISVPLYESFIARLEEALSRPIQTGRFGADMQVSLVNDGPVTIMLDSKAKE